MSIPSERLLRMRIPLYVAVVMALQGGYWLTSDGFGLLPHLPIVFAIVACVLVLRHGHTTDTWASRPPRDAWRRVVIVAALLVASALVNLWGSPVEAAGKIASCFGLAVALAYVSLFTWVVLRAAKR